MRRLLRRCLDKDPKQRLRDIGDARVELHETDASPRSRHRWSRRGAGRPRGGHGLRAPWRSLPLGSGLWMFPRTAETPWQNPLANAQFTRYTDFEGSELDAAISPDGQFIVFLSNRSGPYEAWLSQVGSGQFVNVSNGRIPALLNDEVRNVGLLTRRPDLVSRGPHRFSGTAVGAGYVVAPVIGGELRPLLDRGINPVWSPDGSRLLYHEPGPGDPIFVADRNGRNPTRVYIAQPGIHCHYLNWSPDGRFIYFVGGIPPAEMDVWRVPSSGGTAERLTFHNSSVAYPVFIDDGTLLYRATAEDGSGPWLYALDVERAPHIASVSEWSSTCRLPRPPMAGGWSRRSRIRPVVSGPFQSPPAIVNESRPNACRCRPSLRCRPDLVRTTSCICPRRKAHVDCGDFRTAKRRNC